jgi:O-antigen/teichoic acid export membrane protein
MDDVETSGRESYPSTRAAFMNTMVVRVVASFLGLANSVLIARALGAEGRGRLSLLLTTAMFLGMVLGPFCASNTILLGREPKNLRTLIYTSAVGVLPSLAVALLVYAFIPGGELAHSLGNVWRLWVGLLFLLLGLQILSGGLNGLLLGKQEFYFANYVAVAGGVVTLALNLGLILWLGLGVTGALLAVVITYVGTSALSLWWLWRAPSLAAEFSRPLFKEGLLIGARAISANLPSLLMLRSDLFLIQYFSGPAQVGTYVVAVNVAEMVLLVSGTLNTIAFAKAASQSGVEDSVIRSSKFSLIVGLVFWLLLTVTGSWLFPRVFGAEFGTCFIPCLIVMAGVCMWSFSAPLAGYIVGRKGYPRGYVLLTWAGFVINLLVNVILIPRYQIVGAAAGTAIAYFVTSVFVLLMFARMTRRTLTHVLIPNTADLDAAFQGYLLMKSRILPSR